MGTGELAFEGSPVEFKGDCIEDSQPFCGYEAAFGDQSTVSAEDGAHECLDDTVRSGGMGDSRTVEDAVCAGERGENLIAEMCPLV